MEDKSLKELQESIKTYQQLLAFIKIESRQRCKSPILPTSIQDKYGLDLSDTLTHALSLIYEIGRESALNDVVNSINIEINNTK